jgi:hypothetical protein
MILALYDTTGVTLGGDPRSWRAALLESPINSVKLLSGSRIKS